MSDITLNTSAYPMDSEVVYTEDSDGNVAISYDRAVDSSVLRTLYSNLYTDGISPNDSSHLQVTAGSGMTVNVAPGFCILAGVLKVEIAIRNLAVQAANALYDRIDMVVMRLNDNRDVRTVDIYVVEGTAATIPTAPALTRSESIYEIGLATLFISKNTTTVSQERITDLRYNTAYCGVITSPSEFDTTFIYNQIQAALSEFETTSFAEFDAWFEEMKDQLSEDAAGSLQTQVNALKNPEFTEATTLSNIVTEESLNVMLGKIAKWYTDRISKIGNPDSLPTVSKELVGSIDEINNLINKRLINETILYNPLNVDVNNIWAELNQTHWPCYGGQTDSVNFPIAGEFVGVRKPIRYFNGNWFFVEMLEMYPVPGRVWVNHLDSATLTWGGWASEHQYIEALQAQITSHIGGVLFQHQWGSSVGPGNSMVVQSINGSQLTTGYIVVEKLSSAQVRISGNAKINYVGEGYAAADFGVKLSAISALVASAGYSISPLVGYGAFAGKCTIYNSTGAIDAGLNGYGGVMVQLTDVIAFMRIYTTEGAVGAWNNQGLPTGTSFDFECYAALS